MRPDAAPGSRFVVRLAFERAEIGCELVFGNAAISGPDDRRHGELNGAILTMLLSRMALAFKGSGSGFLGTQRVRLSDGLKRQSGILDREETICKTLL
jgi:hypothetical protein